MSVATYSNSYLSKELFINILQDSNSHCSYSVNMIYVTYTNYVKSSDILLQSGSTPLHAAAAAPAASSLWGSNEQIIEILIKAGADVNATDEVSYYGIIV